MMEPEQARTEEAADPWARVDAACRKLWEEDRVSAIPVQAAIEELRVEWGRVEQSLESLRSARDAIHSSLLKEFDLQYGDRLTDLEKRLDSATRRSAALQESLDKERERTRGLLSSLEGKDDELSRFKQETLAAEASRDAERIRRVEDFQRDFQAKTENLERDWAERLRAFESEYRTRREALELQYRKAFDDMLGREMRCREREEALRVQAEDLNMRSQSLEREYLQKRGELETLKARMQAEINELVRAYQPGRSDQTKP